jgi:peroxiredoxin
MKKAMFFLLVFAFIPLFGDQVAEDVRLYTIDGKYFNTRDERAKPDVKYLLIDFFSLNCVSCRKHITDVQKIAEKHRSSGLFSFVVSLPSDPELNEAAEKKLLAEFMKKNGITMPVVYDLYTLTAEKFGVKKGDNITIPHYFLIDRKGLVVSSSEKWEGFSELIESLMKLNKTEKDLL